MLACGSIQKIERYGQLGLKRRSVDDFLSASLSDSRRGNIYALTHKQTWRDCVEALRVAASSPLLQSAAVASRCEDGAGGDEGDLDHEGTSSAGGSYSTAMVTDSLVYAISFSTALVAHHLRELSNQRLHHRGDAPRKRVVQSGDPEALRGAVDLSFMFRGTAMHTNVFPSATVDAADLLLTLRDLQVTIHQNTAITRKDGSDLTLAYAHLLSNLLDLYCSIVALQASLASPCGASACGEAAATGVNLPVALCEGCLLARKAGQELLACCEECLHASLQDFMVSYAKHPSDNLFSTRMCPHGIRQQLNRFARQGEQEKQMWSNAGDHRGAATRCSQLETSCDTGGVPPGTLQEMLPKTLLQAQYDAWWLARRASQHQSTGARGAGREGSTKVRALAATGDRSGGEDGGTTAILFSFPPWAKLDLFQKMCLVGQLSDRLLLQFAAVLVPVSSNRATRYNIYYRGDEAKLLHNNVKGSECALFTHVSTPPVEPELLEALFNPPKGQLLTLPLEEPSSVDCDGHRDLEQVKEGHAMLLLMQWMSSIPLFFLSFVESEGWTSFSQEQRRLVLLRESEVRKQQRQKLRKPDSGNRARSGARADDRESIAGASSLATSDGEADETHSGTGHGSVRSGGDAIDAQSCLSVGARSMLSTFSASSTASFLSFISVLDPLQISSDDRSFRSRGAGNGAGRGDGTEGGSGADGDDESVSGSVMKRRRQVALMEPFQAYESEDGNTNLPLILLEYSVLGLHQFGTATKRLSLSLGQRIEQGEDTDTYRRKRFCCDVMQVMAWQSIGQLYGIVQALLSTRSEPLKGAALTQCSPCAGAAGPVSSGFAAESGGPAALGFSTGFSFNNLQQRLRKRMAASPTSTIFDFSQDVRFNRGLGYETLGVLFAAIVTPQLDIEDGDEADRCGERLEKRTIDLAVETATVLGTAPVALRGSACTVKVRSDPLWVRQGLKAPLAQCLAAYEGIAPQVINLHLAPILRVAARSVSGVGDSAAVVDTPLLIGFLCRITKRLGDGNQVPILLREMVRCATHGEEVAVSGTGRTHALALEKLFCTENLRRALVDACRQTLDPEALLNLLVSIANDVLLAQPTEEAAPAKDTQHTGVASLSICTAHFLLMLFAIVLEGVRPSSLAASAMLEKTTELEMLLSIFLVSRIYEPFFAGDTAEVAASEATRFTFDLTASRRSRAGRVDRAQLQVLSAAVLAALYHCRCLTETCLEDLGLQSVEGYLRLLEDSLWQFSTRIECVAGTLTLDDLLEKLFAADHYSHRASSSDGITVPPHAPDPKVLLHKIVMQRLSLARSVCLLLGAGEGDEGPNAPSAEAKQTQRKEARRLAHYVLDSTSVMLEVSEHRTPLAPRGARARVMFTEDDWSALLTYAKRNRVRKACMAMLLNHYRSQLARGTTSDGPSDARVVSTPLEPGWFVSCLESTGGELFNVLTETVLASTLGCEGEDDEGLQESDAMEAMLVRLAAYQDAVRSLGGAPSWRQMLRKLTAWLQCYLPTTSCYGISVECHSLDTLSANGNVVDQFVLLVMSLISDIMTCVPEFARLMSSCLQGCSADSGVGLESDDVDSPSAAVVAEIHDAFSASIGKTEATSAGGDGDAEARHEIHKVISAVFGATTARMLVDVVERSTAATETLDWAVTCTGSDRAPSAAAAYVNRAQAVRMWATLRNAAQHLLGQLYKTSIRLLDVAGAHAAAGEADSSASKSWKKVRRFAQATVDSLHDRLGATMDEERRAIIPPGRQSAVTVKYAPLSCFLETTSELVSCAEVPPLNNSTLKKAASEPATKRGRHGESGRSSTLGGHQISAAIPQHQLELHTAWAAVANTVLHHILKLAQETDEGTEGTLAIKAAHRKPRSDAGVPLGAAEESSIWEQEAATVMMDCFSTLYGRLRKSCAEVRAREVSSSASSPTMEMLRAYRYELRQRKSESHGSVKALKRLGDGSGPSSGGVPIPEEDLILDQQLLDWLLGSGCVAEPPTAFESSTLHDVNALFATVAERIVAPGSSTVLPLPGCHSTPSGAEFLLSLLVTPSGVRLFWILFHLYCARATSSGGLFAGLREPSRGGDRSGLAIDYWAYAARETEGATNRWQMKLQTLLVFYWVRSALETVRLHVSFNARQQVATICSVITADQPELIRALRLAAGLAGENPNADEATTASQRPKAKRDGSGTVLGELRCAFHGGLKVRNPRETTSRVRGVAAALATSRPPGGSEDATCLWLQMQLLVAPSIISCLGAMPPLFGLFYQHVLLESLRAPSDILRASPGLSCGPNDAQYYLAAGSKGLPRRRKMKSVDVGAGSPRQRHRWARLLRAAGLSMRAIFALPDQQGIAEWLAPCFRQSIQRLVALAGNSRITALANYPLADGPSDVRRPWSESLRRLDEVVAFLEDLCCWSGAGSLGRATTFSIASRCNALEPAPVACERSVALEPSSGHSLWHVVLDLCGSAAARHHMDLSFVDCELEFVMMVLEQELLAHQRGGLADNEVHRLTWSELFHIIQVTSEVWLPSGCLLSRISLIPPFFASLFAAILGLLQRDEGASECAGGGAKMRRRALYVFTGLLHQLAQSCDRVAGEDEDDDDGGVELLKCYRLDSDSLAMDYGTKRGSGTTQMEEVAGGAAALLNATRRAALSVLAQPGSWSLMLASLTSSLFQVAAHAVPVFTKYSSDLDNFCASVLTVLKRQPLPRVRAPRFTTVFGKMFGLQPRSLAHHSERGNDDGQAISKEGAALAPHLSATDADSDANTTLDLQNVFGFPSDVGYADLAFVCVGSDEGRGLLRQAAMRLREEEGERKGAWGDGGCGNHLFQVS